jgi:prepilin-type N-terminal cleavage/methylation domain-containing protein
MKKYKRIHRAFSIIEVIFVLVILGIISSIGSSIIVQVYESYITQNALYKVTTQTELVSNQLVNRLSYAIKNSVISKVTKDDGSWNLYFRSSMDENTSQESDVPQAIETENWLKLEDIMFGTSDFVTIEWIGYDNDSFSADTIAGWSGIADYSEANISSFKTPHSNLSLANDIISNLSADKVNLNDTALNNPAVIFTKKTGSFVEDGAGCMGLIDNNSSCIFPVKMLNNTQLEFLGTAKSTPKTITERYKLVWSAYAISPENPRDIDGDGEADLWELAFYYNYQPWNGENYKEHGTRKLLMRNLSVFKFTENGGIIQFKLCASSPISEKLYISTCKEKVVLR